MVKNSISEEFFGKLDRFLDPSVYIERGSGKIMELIEDKDIIKKEMKKLKRLFPKSYKFYGRYNKLREELEDYDNTIKYFKKDLKKWIKIAKERNISIGKSKLKELKELQKVI